MKVASNEVEVVVGTRRPQAPTTPAVLVSGNTVNLSWSSGGGPVSAYRLEAGTSTGLTDVGVFDLGLNNAIASGTAPTPAPLVWVNRRGIEETFSIPPGVYTIRGCRPTAVASRDNSDIWVYDLDRGTPTRLTSEGGNLWPVWTPDGTRIAFSSNRHGSSSLFSMRTDGDRTVERLTTTDTIHAATSWSPAGDVLLLMSVNAASNTDIHMLNRTAGDVFARRLVAYVSNDSGRDEVFVRPFPDGERHWPISPALGRSAKFV